VMPEHKPNTLPQAEKSTRDRKHDTNATEPLRARSTLAEECDCGHWPFDTYDPPEAERSSRAEPSALRALRLL